MTYLGPKGELKKEGQLRAMISKLSFLFFFRFCLVYSFCSLLILRTSFDKSRTLSTEQSCQKRTFGKTLKASALSHFLSEAHSEALLLRVVGVTLFDDDSFLTEELRSPERELKKTLKESSLGWIYCQN